jgi:predicted AAA+ superfamily ATPase
MTEFTNDYLPCRDLLLKRLREPVPGRIQLLTGPRQVGKTTLLLEIDAVFQRSWGDWAIEIKTGGFHPYDLKRLLEFCRRNTKFRPLVITAPGGESIARRRGLMAISWKQFLVYGPPQP